MTNEEKAIRYLIGLIGTKKVFQMARAFDNYDEDRGLSSKFDDAAQLTMTTLAKYGYNPHYFEEFILDARSYLEDEARTTSVMGGQQ